MKLVLTGLVLLAKAQARDDIGDRLAAYIDEFTMSSLMQTV